MLNRICLLAVVLLSATVSATFAAPPRLLPEGQVVQPAQDYRLGPKRTLNSYFPMEPVNSKAAWEKRKAELVLRTKVACGVWPEPTRTPLNARVHGKVERDDFTVQRVIFESVPGHYVTGSLFMPKELKGKGKHPGVLCPHGHWPNGRFYQHGGGVLRRQLAIGGERFEKGGRAPIQARCVQLARMGCIVFHYDMIGYADAVQLAHRPGVRESMNKTERGQWGFFSPQADLRLNTMYTQQTWNSVRALDFLLSMPQVDAKRIAVTGASGGATQTMMITAVDDRVDLAFPAVMVSTAMQGGCTCENTHYLRIDSGNIDIAAVTAPRPLGITAADDWTIQLQRLGDPALKKLYAMLGVKDRYIATFNTHFKHNFNHVSRTTMYSFVNKHFKLGFRDPVLESDYEPLSREELTVWTDKHTKPGADNTGDAHERKLLNWYADDTDNQLAELLPKDAASMKRYREVIGSGWRVMIGRDMPKADDIGYELVEKTQKDGYLQMTAWLRSKHVRRTHPADPKGTEPVEATVHEATPTVFLYPDQWDGRVAIMVTPTGKAELFDAKGEPTATVKRLLRAGVSVAGLDLFQQGEFRPADKPLEQVELTVQYKTDWGRFSGYTFGYNHPLFSQRVHDLMKMVAFVQGHRRKPKAVAMIGLPGAGHWVAATRAMVGGAINTAILDPGFRFASLNRASHPDFLPGAVRYGDLPGALALGAPHSTTLVGKPAAVVTAAYHASAQAKDIQSVKSINEAITRWLGF